MAYILLTENCTGSNIKFIERDGKLLSKPVGKKYSGTLALQDLGDGNHMRITFADAKNVLAGAVKKLSKLTWSVYKENPVKAYTAGNADYLCHFDFSKSELRSGKKKIECQIQIAGIMMIAGLFCYDFGSHTGCSYIFSNNDDVKIWARELGLNEITLLNAYGEIDGTIPVDGNAEESPYDGINDIGQAAYSIDADLCLYCGTCEEICPVGAIQGGDSSYVIDPSLCVDCGACSSACPIDAIGCN